MKDYTDYMIENKAAASRAKSTQKKKSLIDAFNKKHNTHIKYNTNLTMKELK